MSNVVIISHRGQTLTLVSANVQTPGTEPWLKGVSDWVEKACVTQAPGYEQGESPSATVEIDNAGGLAAAALDYPLGALVVIQQDGEGVFVGTLSRYSLGAVIEIGLEV